MEQMLETPAKRIAFSLLLNKIVEGGLNIDFNGYGHRAIGFNEKCKNIYISLDIGMSMFINLDDDKHTIKYLWTDPNDGEEFISENINTIGLIMKHFEMCEFCNEPQCEYCNEN